LVEKVHHILSNLTPDLLCLIAATNNIGASIKAKTISGCCSP
jgi:hypothetical protein